MYASLSHSPSIPNIHPFVLLRHPSATQPDIYWVVAGKGKLGFVAGGHVRERRWERNRCLQQVRPLVQDGLGERGWGGGSVPGRYA